MRSRQFEAIASFKSEGDILRGVPVSSILALFGIVLSGSAGVESDYAKSHRVDHLGDFISHNWSVGRFRKFLALGFHYNLVPAVVVGWTVGAAAAALTSLGVLPSASSSSPPPWARIFGYLAFVISLMTWQEPKRLFGFDRSEAFFDKLCIHQTDKVVQRRGIEKLAAFLKRSNRMVIVYTDVYLRKLWTVYEVASFLTLHKDPTRMVLISTEFPVFLLVYQFSALVYEFSKRHLETMEGQRYLGINLPEVALALLYMTGTCLVARAWGRTVHRMREVIGAFSIREAKCSVEEDRALVQANVHSVMCSLGIVAASAPEAEALDAFDRLARAEMPVALRASLGRQLFPYKLMVSCGMVQMLWAFDYLSGVVGDVPDSVAFMKMVGIASKGVFSPLAIMPVNGVVIGYTMCRLPSLTGWWNAGYLCLAIPATLVLSLAMPAVRNALLTMLDAQQTFGGAAMWLTIVLLFYTSLSIATTQLYRPRPRPPPLTQLIAPAPSAELAGLVASRGQTFEEEVASPEMAHSPELASPAVVAEGVPAPIESAPVPRSVWAGRVAAEIV